MKSAGDLVAAAAELSAGVQDRHDDLESRLPQFDVLVDRNAAAVVSHPDRAVGANGDVDVIAVARDRLVHAVIHDLVDQMVQTTGISAADIHSRPPSNGFQALEHLNIGGGVTSGGDICHEFRTFQLVRSDAVMAGRVPRRALARSR